MKEHLKRGLKRVIRAASGLNQRYPSAEREALLLGQIAARQISEVERARSLADVEFSVFSQWGEDGIIEWLISHSDEMPDSFIEFGVENYCESNTRFLLQNRNWRGLVIDGSEDHVATIKGDQVSWRHDLTAVCSFITRDNIENVIANAGFSGEIGLLSIDIDGNDYWIWEAVANLSPCFVIVEYNGNFGDLFPLTIPYRDDFLRTAADASNLYYGASCQALTYLAGLKGYLPLGSNRTGSNLFFARSDFAEPLLKRLSDTSPRACRAREARGPSGELTLIGGLARTALIADKIVVDVTDGRTGPLHSFGDLFSERWRAAFLSRPCSV